MKMYWWSTSIALLLKYSLQHRNQETFILYISYNNIQTRILYNTPRKLNKSYVVQKKKSSDVKLNVFNISEATSLSGPPLRADIPGVSVLVSDHFGSLAGKVLLENLVQLEVVHLGGQVAHKH